MAQVAQADTQLSSGSVVTVNVGLFGANLHAGSFDDAYLNSASPSISGHMYVCGKASGLDNPTLYRIGFNGTGVMNSSLDALAPSQLQTTLQSLATARNALRSPKS